MRDVFKIEAEKGRQERKELVDELLSIIAAYDKRFRALGVIASKWAKASGSIEIGKRTGGGGDEAVGGATE